MVAIVDETTAAAVAAFVVETVAFPPNDDDDAEVEGTDGMPAAAIDDDEDDEDEVLGCTTAVYAGQRVDTEESGCAAVAGSADLAETAGMEAASSEGGGKKEK